MARLFVGLTRQTKLWANRRRSRLFTQNQQCQLLNCSQDCSCITVAGGDYIEQGLSGNATNACLCKDMLSEGEPVQPLVNVPSEWLEAGQLSEDISRKITNLKFHKILSNFE